MVATVHHVTSSSGLRKFQADGFLFDSVYKKTEERIEMKKSVYFVNMIDVARNIKTMCS